MSERSRPFFSGPFTTDEIARLDAAIDARLVERNSRVSPESPGVAVANALPPAPVFDQAELDAAMLMRSHPAPDFDAGRGGFVVRSIKRVVNLVLGPVRLPQRRFNAAVAERLVAAEQGLHDALAFGRVLRDELSLQRAALDGLLRAAAELRERVDRFEARVGSAPREQP